MRQSYYDNDAFYSKKNINALLTTYTLYPVTEISITVLRYQFLIMGLSIPKNTPYIRVQDTFFQGN